MLFSTVAVPIYNPTNSVVGSLSPQHSLFLSFLMTAILIEIISHCNFDFHFSFSLFHFFFFFFAFLRAVFVAYEGSQARGRIRAIAASLYSTAHGNAGSLTC